MSGGGIIRGAIKNARDDRERGVWRVVWDVAKMHRPDKSKLEVLWRARHSSLQEVAAIIRGIFHGYGNATQRENVRSKKQQRELHAEKLPMGDAARTGEQSTDADEGRGNRYGDFNVTPEHVRKHVHYRTKM